MIDELPDDRLDEAATLLSRLTTRPIPAVAGDAGDHVVSVQDVHNDEEVAARAAELLARRAGRDVTAN
jgi:hypothetical protein